MPTSEAEQADIDRSARKLILDRFLETGRPPVAEEIGLELGRSVSEVEQVLERLERAHQIQRVPGTRRILMAFPFSAVATPYRVRVKSGREYFANCAWDAVAFHVMLRQPITIESFCDVCSRPVLLELENGRLVRAPDPAPVIYLALLPKDWWANIIFTCGNTMVFWHSPTHAADVRARDPDAAGEAVSIPTMLALSQPLYATKLDRDYERPTSAQLNAVYQSLGLHGPFWES